MLCVSYVPDQPREATESMTWGVVFVDSKVAAAPSRKKRPARTARSPHILPPSLFGEIVNRHSLECTSGDGSFTRILSALPVALIGVDASSRVILISSGSQRILDPLDERVIGQPVAAVLKRLGQSQHAPGLEGLGALLQSASGAIEASSGWRFELHRENLTRLIHAEFSPLSPPANSSGLSGILVLQDITDAQRLEETTREVAHLASLGQVAACIAHEVRNPLSAMTSAAEFLAEVRSDDEYVAHYTRIIVDEAQRLERLINDFLAHARPPVLRFLPVSVEDVLRRCCVLLERDAAAVGVTVEYRKRSSPPPLSADPEALLQALLNLGKNAVEATQPGGRVTFSTRCSPTLPGFVEVHIRDTGVGIARTDIPQVLMPFFTTKDGGTGLGLPIAKKIIEGHGGRLILSSQPGRGTKAWFTLPIVRE